MWAASELALSIPTSILLVGSFEKFGDDIDGRMTQWSGMAEAPHIPHLLPIFSWRHLREFGEGWGRDGERRL